MKEQDITRKMLHTIREGAAETRKANAKPDVENTATPKEMTFLEEAEYLMSRVEKKKLNEEDTTQEKDKGFPIKKNTPQFGDVKQNQVAQVIKAVGENVEISDEDGLIFYPKDKDLVLTGKIKSLNMAFQFRYADPSGDGVYLWLNGCQLTDSNLRTIGKIRDAFVNWKQSLVQNGDLLDKLYKVSQRFE